jgi:ParB family chromosome partitioning protein
MSTKKPVLGRGLEALLPGPVDTDRDATTGEQNLYDFQEHYRLAGRVTEVSLSNIRPNPYQPRKNFDADGLSELAASIKQFGLIQPVTVRSVGAGRFELISGERRWRASRMAGLDRIPAYVREADSESMLEMALVENVQREELDPIEVAQGYQRLIEECSLTHDQIAEKIGKNRPTITNTLRLLRLPPSVQLSLRKREISVGHARALISVEEPEHQERLLGAILSLGLSVRQTEERVRALSRPSPARRKDLPEGASPSTDDQRDQAQLKSIEDRLRRHLSTQIQIRRQSSDGRGKIEIQFYSDDDLGRLLEILLAED